MGENTSEKWGVFICYRQTDGKEAAQWLYARLNGSTLPVIPEGLSKAPHLDVYFDQTAPAVEDWTEIHQPALQRAKAFLMVCSPGAKHRVGEDDWVHRELEWWLNNRDSAPIVIDSTGEGERWIPDEVMKKWPNAQRVLVRPDKWENLSNKDREQEESNTHVQIVKGIRSSERGVSYEDLEREKKRSRQLERQRVGLSVLVVVAIALVGYVSWQQRVANYAKEQALIARDDARTAKNVALRSAKQLQKINKQLSASRPLYVAVNEAPSTSVGANWYSVANTFSRATAVLVDRSGIRGSGVVARASALRSDWVDEPVLLTMIANSSEDTLSDKYEIQFPALDQNARYSLGDVLWVSKDKRKRSLGVTVVRFNSELPKDVVMVEKFSDMEYLTDLTEIPAGEVNHFSADVASSYKVALSYANIHGKGLIFIISKIVGKSVLYGYSSIISYHATAGGAGGAPVFDSESGDFICLHAGRTGGVGFGYSFCTWIGDILAEIRGKQIGSSL